MSVLLCRQLNDVQLNSFYAQSEDFKANRSYSIVVGPTKDETCGLYKPNEGDMFLSTTYNNTVVTRFSLL